MSNTRQGVARSGRPSDSAAQRPPHSRIVPTIPRAVGADAARAAAAAGWTAGLIYSRTISTWVGVSPMTWKPSRW